MRTTPTLFAWFGQPALGRWVFLSALLIFLVLPLVPLLLWSGAFNWFFPSVLPTVWSGRAWTYALSPTADVLPALWNSAVIAFTTVAISLAVGIPAGRAIGLYDFRGKRIVEFLILAPTIVPPLAVVLGIHVVFIRLGLSDSITGVVLVHLIPVLPYVTMILSGVFANYETEYEEQARSLGARPLSVVFWVMLPAIFPGVMVAALFAFLISWSQYVVTLLIGGGQVQTLPLLLYAFVRSGDYAISGAIAIIFIGPGVLMLILTARYLTGRNQSIGGLGGA